MNKEQHPDDLSLLVGGPSFHIAQRLGLASPKASRQVLKILLVILVAWGPLVVCSLAAGQGTGTAVRIPFFSDLEVQARFLFVLPLLMLPMVAIAKSLAVVSRHFRERSVVPEHEWPRFRAAQERAIRGRNSLAAEGLMLVIALAVSAWLRLSLQLDVGDSSWERVGAKISPAGWWYMLVSMPLLYFLLLRWVWIFLLWARYLFQISRLDLTLTATHPDRSGGLGFVGWGMIAFAIPLMALSGIFSAALGDLIVNHNESLDSLKFHVIVFVIVALLVVHLPLLAFSARIMRCRFQGLLDFGALVWKHDQAFDEKWIKEPTRENLAKLLGTPDVQSLADLALCYEHVSRMWPLPLDLRASAVLFVAALVPMIPLVGTAIPLSEIFMKLAELLV